MSADEENTPTPRPAGFLLSQLPVNMRASALNIVKELDVNGDGYLDNKEMAEVLNQLNTSRKQTKRITKIAGGLALLVLLLIGAVFSSSVAAAYIAKDTSIDSYGILHDKSTGYVVQTSEAVMQVEGRKLMNMTSHELQNLKSIVQLEGDEGDLHFMVKGFARPLLGERKLIVLVEGGTITYDMEGMVDATGDALLLINAAYSYGAASDENNGATGRSLSDTGRPFPPKWAWKEM